MNLVERLPFPPMPDESLRGLLVRVAEDNFCTPIELAGWAGSSRMDLECVDVETAAVALGMDPSLLLTMGFGDGGRGRGSIGRLLTSADSFLRWCPACLAEARYHRRAWEKGYVGACPTHRLRLLDRCPACVSEGRHGKVSWKFANMSLCPWGHRLAEQPAESLADRDGTALLHRAYGIPCEGPELPPELRSLSLEPLLEFLLFLGRLRYVVADGNPGAISTRAMAFDPIIIESGARVALGWPSTLDDLAGAVRRAYGKPGRLSEQYGTLHRFVARLDREPYADSAREAYAAHLLGRPDGPGPEWPLFLPRPPDTDDTLGIEDARLLLDLGAVSFRKLRDLDAWKELPIALTTRAGVEYRRNDLFELRERIEGWLSPAAMADRLGLGSEERLSKLCAVGMMPLIQWNRHRRNGVGTSIDTREAWRLIDEIVSHATSEPPEHPVGFGGLLQKASNRQVIELVPLVRSLLAGRPRAFVGHPDRAGFQSFTFEEAEVELVLGELSEPTLTGWMFLGDVVRYLGIPAAAVHAIAAKTSSLRCYGRRGNLYRLVAVREAAAAYICHRDVPCEPRRSAKAVRDMLSAAGIAAIVEVKVPGKGVTAVYPRRDVMRMIEAEKAAKEAARPEVIAAELRRERAAERRMERRLRIAAAREPLAGSTS